LPLSYKIRFLLQTRFDIDFLFFQEELEFFSGHVLLHVFGDHLDLIDNRLNIVLSGHQLDFLLCILGQALDLLR
jgi:hypothetical protein